MTSQDTPEAVERLAEDCDARSCDGGSDPLLQDITAALRAYAQLLRRVEQARAWTETGPEGPPANDYQAGMNTAKLCARNLIDLLDGEPGAQP